MVDSERVLHPARSRCTTGCSTSSACRAWRPESFEQAQRPAAGADAGGAAGPGWRSTSPRTTPGWRSGGAGRRPGGGDRADRPTAAPGLGAGRPAGPLDLGALARRSSMSVLGSIFAAIANVALVVAGHPRPRPALGRAVLHRHLALPAAGGGLPAGHHHRAGVLHPPVPGDRAGRPAAAAAAGGAVAGAAGLGRRRRGVRRRRPGGGRRPRRRPADGELVTALRVLAVFLPVAARLRRGHRGHPRLPGHDARPSWWSGSAGRWPSWCWSPARCWPARPRCWCRPGRCRTWPRWWPPAGRCTGCTGRTPPGAGPLAAGRPRWPAPFWRYTAPRVLANVAQIALQRLDIVLVGAAARAGRGGDLRGRHPLPGGRPARQPGRVAGRAADARRAAGDPGHRRHPHPLPAVHRPG